MLLWAALRDVKDQLRARLVGDNAF